MPRAEVRLPKIGLVMDNSRVVRWRKAIGDTVSIGEPLLELETEKSIVEVEATQAGILEEIVCPPEAMASVGDLLAYLTVDGGVVGQEPRPAASADTPVVIEQSHTSNVGNAARAQVPSNRTDAASATSRIRSSPAARRLAAERGVDLGHVAGSGPNGRIQMTDIVKTATAAATIPTQLSAMRRAVARSMTESARSIPQFSLESTIDLHGIVQHRLQQTATRPSVTDYLIAAIGRTLPRFPAANALFVGSPDDPDARIDPVKGAHVSLVVAVPDGLHLVTLHDVEALSLAEVTALRTAAVARARDGRLARDDLRIGNFGLSNLGPSGPERFTAMLSPAQSGILAVGREREALVVRDGSIMIRRVMTVTLTVDHRVIDGRLAAEFLSAMIACAESDWTDF